MYPGRLGPRWVSFLLRMDSRLGDAAYKEVLSKLGHRAEAAVHRTSRIGLLKTKKTSENHRLSLTQPDYAASAGGFYMFDVSDLAWPGREALPESPWSVGMCWI